jgi:DinB family protein
MLDRFAAVLTAATGRLRLLSPAEAASRPQPGGWSKKEELGHLVDSAINNYARIIRVQMENAPALPGYQQDAWVERQGYDDRDWRELIALWSALNEHMLAAAARIPSAALARTCTIAGSQPMTLEFVIEDYVDHMVHHLQHIGVALGEFRRPQSAYA